MSKRWSEEQNQKFVELYCHYEAVQGGTKAEIAILAQDHMVESGVIGSEQERNMTSHLVWNFRDSIEAERLRREMGPDLDARQIQPIKQESDKSTGMDFLRVLTDPIADNLVAIIVKLLSNDKVRSALKDALQEDEATRRRPIIHNYVPGSQTESKRKRKVLIVGLLPIQTQEVKKELGAYFNFVFLEVEDDKRRMKEHAKTADMVIGVIGFINHGIEAALRAGCMKGNGEYVRANGGVSELKRILAVYQAV